jgi:hypothetical protein
VFSAFDVRGYQTLNQDSDVFIVIQAISDGILQPDSHNGRTLHFLLC